MPPLAAVIPAIIGGAGAALPGIATGLAVQEGIMNPLARTKQAEAQKQQSNMQSQNQMRDFFAQQMMRQQQQRQQMMQQYNPQVYSMMNQGRSGGTYGQ